MDHTIVVAANAADPAALQYIAPYAGCCDGRGVHGQGKDASIIYDDLSKHAWAYRQMSLLLRRPAGPRGLPRRRLLPAQPPAGARGQAGARVRRRLADCAPDHRDAGRRRLRLRADERDFDYRRPDLPGSDLFAAGIRPAINAGLSVSRVGGAAQTKAMRQVAGGMRLGLAQYRELQAFAQFGTAELDAATRRQLDLGQRLTEILKQPQYQPLTLGHEVTIIYAVVNGYLNDIEPAKVRDFEEPSTLHGARSQSQTSLDDDRAETKAIDDELDREAATDCASSPVQEDGGAGSVDGSRPASRNPAAYPLRSRAPPRSRAQWSSSLRPRCDAPSSTPSPRRPYAEQLRWVLADLAETLPLIDPETATRSSRLAAEVEDGRADPRDAQPRPLRRASRQPQPPRRAVRPGRGQVPVRVIAVGTQGPRLHAPHRPGDRR